MGAIRDALETLLQPREPEAPPWKYLPLVLVLAFAARAAVALGGDFIVHSDEIMQYLEPAHRLAFGNGIVHWEYFYGARSWLLPGFIAGVLRLFEFLGLDQPFWYANGVELVLCAASLLIPAGMYFFARHCFTEVTARVALLAGAFWYELVGFAHRPMTEFVATDLLVVLLALSVRPAVGRNDGGPGRIWLVAALAVLTAAIRVQYAPLALILLGVVFLRSERKVQLTLAAALCFLAVGVFDAITWGGSLFHSYLTYIRYQLHFPYGFLSDPPFYQYVWRLMIASTGLSVLCIAAALGAPRRYALLLVLIAVILLLHSAQAHMAYRFIFAVIPLWLLIGADLLARMAARVRPARWSIGCVASTFVAISVAGILNMLPWQDRAYLEPTHAEPETIRFIRNQSHSQIITAYRYLATAPGVFGVWQPDRPYAATPGYYYLHRKVPFYDMITGGHIEDVATAMASVSHIVVAKDSQFEAPGYSVVKTFGPVLVLRRDQNDALVLQWEQYVPIYLWPPAVETMEEIGTGGRVPPPNWGIRLVR